MLSNSYRVYCVSTDADFKEDTENHIRVKTVRVVKVNHLGHSKQWGTQVELYSVKQAKCYFITLTYETFLVLDMYFLFLKKMVRVEKYF